MNKTYDFCKKIILLRGNAGSGKDTVAKIIRNELQNVTTMAFADPMKEFAYDIFNIPTDFLWGPSGKRSIPIEIRDWNAVEDNFSKHSGFWCKKIIGFENPSYSKFEEKLNSWFQWIKSEHKNNPLTSRKLLQTLGTECGRSYDENIWVSYAFYEAKKFLRNPHTKFILITDGRFINECRSVRENNGIVIFVKRNDIKNQSTHRSEIDNTKEEMLLYDSEIIENNETLEELRKKVCNCLNKIF